MGVGDGSIVGDELASGVRLAGIRVNDGATVGGAWVKVTVATTKRVTVGGSGVVSALTAMAASAPRLAKANARHRTTAQKPTKSKMMRRTWLRGTRLRSNSIGIRVYHRDIRPLSGMDSTDARDMPGRNAGVLWSAKLATKALLDTLF